MSDLFKLHDHHVPIDIHNRHPFDVCDIPILINQNHLWISFLDAEISDDAGDVLLHFWLQCFINTTLISWNNLRWFRYFRSYYLPNWWDHSKLWWMFVFVLWLLFNNCSFDWFYSTCQNSKNICDLLDLLICLLYGLDVLLLKYLEWTFKIYKLLAES